MWGCGSCKHAGIDELIPTLTYRLDDCVGCLLPLVVIYGCRVWSSPSILFQHLIITQTLYLSLISQHNCFLFDIGVKDGLDEVQDHGGDEEIPKNGDKWLALFIVIGLVQLFFLCFECFFEVLCQTDADAFHHCDQDVESLFSEYCDDEKHLNMYFYYCFAYQRGWEECFEGDSEMPACDSS